MGIFDKGVQKTKRSFFERLSRAVVGKSRVDDDLLDAIEEALVASDMGVDTTLKIIDNLEERVHSDKYVSLDELTDMLRDEIGKLLDISEGEEDAAEPFDFSKKPYVILVVGVNGVGKTTSIAKLAYRYKKQGKKILLAAGDTFRAGAVEQLSIWASRLEVDIVKGKPNADPASVAFDGAKAAREGHYDLLIVDTAGRQQTKANLMNELGKIRRVIARELPESPIEAFLVIDATTGQNGVSQAKAFAEASPLTGIVITKMDGTSKGGIILSIRDEIGAPVRFIGLGEKMEDLVEFDLDEYLHALLVGDDNG